MRIAPIISLGLSILVGIAAVFLGRGWLNNEAEANSSSAPAVIFQDVATQRILVADITIERGDLLQAGSFRQADWPVDHVPQGAVEDIDAILSAEGGYPYSLGLMVPGEPLLTAKLSHAAVRDTLAAVIEPGFRAVSVEVSDASGVAGFVLPNHRVDVNVFTEERDFDTGEPIHRALTLLENVRVLAVDQSFQEKLEGAAPARTVTLQVTPEQSRKLGLAAQTAEIGLVLRPQGNEAISEPKPIQRRKAVVTPALIKAPAAPQPAFADIRIIQGEEEETVTAPVARATDLNGGQNQ